MVVDLRKNQMTLAEHRERLSWDAKGGPMRRDEAERCGYPQEEIDTVFGPLPTGYEMVYSEDRLPPFEETVARRVASFLGSLYHVRKTGGY